MTRVYAMRNPLRSAFRCDPPPGAAHIIATVQLYMNIFNLFISLLQLLGFARDE